MGFGFLVNYFLIFYDSILLESLCIAYLQAKVKQYPAESKPHLVGSLVCFF